jgi:hypothetical protein
VDLFFCLTYVITCWFYHTNFPITYSLFVLIFITVFINIHIYILTYCDIYILTLFVISPRDLTTQYIPINNKYIVRNTWKKTKTQVSRKQVKITRTRVVDLLLFINTETPNYNSSGLNVSRPLRIK